MYSLLIQIKLWIFFKYYHTELRELLHFTQKFTQNREVKVLKNLILNDKYIKQALPTRYSFSTFRLSIKSDLKLGYFINFYIFWQTGKPRSFQFKMFFIDSFECKSVMSFSKPNKFKNTEIVLEWLNLLFYLALDLNI